MCPSAVISRHPADTEAGSRDVSAPRYGAARGSQEAIVEQFVRDEPAHRMSTLLKKKMQFMASRNAGAVEEQFL
jgi:hypothetical protein